MAVDGLFFFIDLVCRDWSFFVDDVRYYKTLNQWTFAACDQELRDAQRSEYYRVTNNELVEECCPGKGWKPPVEKCQFKRKVGRKRARLITNLNDMYSVEQMIELIEIKETEMFIEML